MEKEKREIITMTDNGIITIPNNVRMSIGEIADLFGIYYSTAKRYIRAIEKSGIVRGDDSMDCVVEGRNTFSEYYGLEMIIALAFRIQSKNTEKLRTWILTKVEATDPRIESLIFKNHVFLN